MNETTLRELKTIVESAVRPLRATARRKRTVREELLGHLMAVYDEELQRLGDERAALDRATKRFGDPVALTAQLQQGVTRGERLLSRIEQWSLAMDRRILRRPGESTARCATRGALLLFALFASVFLGLVPVAMLLRGLGQGIAAALPLLIGTTLVMSMGSFAFILLAYAMFEALYDPVRRRPARAAVVALLAAVVGPIAALALDWLTAGHRPNAVPNLWSVGVLTAIFIPIALVLAVRVRAAEIRYEQEWSLLDIGQ